MPVDVPVESVSVFRSVWDPNDPCRFVEDEIVGNTSAPLTISSFDSKPSAVGSSRASTPLSLPICSETPHNV